MGDLDSALPATVYQLKLKLSKEVVPLEKNKKAKNLKII